MQDKTTHIVNALEAIIVMRGSRLNDVNAFICLPLVAYVRVSTMWSVCVCVFVCVGVSAFIDKIHSKLMACEHARYKFVR